MHAVRRSRIDGADRSGADSVCGDALGGVTVDLDDRPLVTLEREEFDQTFAEIARPLYVGWLEEARRDASDTLSVSVLAAVLTRGDGTRAVLCAYVDQGDGDAAGSLAEVIGDIGRLGLLQPGERLSRERVLVRSPAP